MRAALGPVAFIANLAATRSASSRAEFRALSAFVAKPGRTAMAVSVERLQVPATLRSPTPNVKASRMHAPNGGECGRENLRLKRRSLVATSVVRRTLILQHFRRRNTA